MRKVLRLGLLMGLCAPLAAQQPIQQKPPQTWQPGVATKYALVSTVDLPPKSHAYRPILQNDVVIVDAAGTVLLSASEHEPLDLVEGNMQFLSAPTMVQVVNNSEAPARVVAIELLRRSDGKVEPCAPPMECSQNITVGGKKAGETATFFTNGFITAEWGGMDANGVMERTYEGKKDKNHLELVALTGLTAAFDGKPEKLQAGSVYAGDVKEVKISAGADQARWCALYIDDAKFVERKENEKKKEDKKKKK